MAMSSAMKPCKHVIKSVNSGDCLDRISSLPDELLSHMLSFLPTRFVVSTSILSTRWRYLFTLSNCLSFEDAPSIDLAARRQTMFKKFVYNVLESNKMSPIKKISLVCRGNYDESDLNAWLSFAAQKGVQELHYNVNALKHGGREGFFMCETLVTLKMIHCYGYCYLKIPLSVWLPRLKILHLEHFNWFDYSAEILFSRCENLEELTLKYCTCYTSHQARHVFISTGLLKVLTVENVCFREALFEIDAPNLACLTYSMNTGVKIVPSWKYSSSLVMAELKFSYSAKDHFDRNSLQYDRELVKAAAYKATKLHLFDDSFELLLSVTENEEMPDFPNLTKFVIWAFPYYKWKYVTSMLDKSPQLETLDFQSGLHRCRSDPESPPLEALIPFSCEAKVIKAYFCWHECSLILVGHLLRNARVLKKLILGRSGNDMAEQLRISKALLMLPRASSDCCIEMK